MSNAKQLTKKQRDIIDDLFAGQLDEQRILKKHKIDRCLYEKWLADENFTREFDRRLDSARRQSDFILVRFASVAAAKLVQLTESENQETARKACLDIIGLLRGTGDSTTRQDDTSDGAQATSNEPELPPELAGRLLAALAANEGLENDK